MSSGGGGAEAQAQAAALVHGALELHEARARSEQRRFRALPRCVQLSLFPSSAARPRQRLWAVWRVSFAEGKGGEGDGDQRLRDEDLLFTEPTSGEELAVLVDVVEEGVDEERDRELLLDRVLSGSGPGPGGKPGEEVRKRALGLRMRLRATTRGREREAMRDAEELLRLEPAHAEATRMRAELEARMAADAAREREMFGGRFVAGQPSLSFPPPPTTTTPEQAKFASDLGLDLNNPLVQAALLKMSKLPRKVADMDLRRERERARSVRFCWFLVGMLVFVVGIFALLRSTALAQSQAARRAPGTSASALLGPPPSTSNHNDNGNNEETCVQSPQH